MRTTQANLIAQRPRSLRQCAVRSSQLAALLLFSLSCKVSAAPQTQLLPDLRTQTDSLPASSYGSDPTATVPNPFAGNDFQLTPSKETATESTANTKQLRPGFPAGTESLMQKLAERGNVTFKEAPLSEVVLIISRQWNVNIVAGSQIDGKVTATYEDESLEKILESILVANGYTYRRIGNSAVIVPAQQSTSTRESLEVEVMQVPVDADEGLDELIEALKLQMSPDGQIQPISSSGKIAVQDTRDRIEAVRAMLREISSGSGEQFVSTQSGSSIVEEVVPSETGDGSAPSTENLTNALELRPQYISVEDLQAPLGLVVGESQLARMQGENAMVVIGSPAERQQAQALLRQLDKPRPQVRITGYIYDLDLGELERIGVDWNQQFMSQAIDANGIPRNLSMSQGGLLTPNAPNNAAQVVTGLGETTAEATTSAVAGAASAAATAATGGQMLFRTLNSGFELQTLVQAFEETEGSRLLADPHVTVVDRHTAQLGIVTQIPVQQLTQTTQGGNIGTTTFQEAGITLDVTPRIASDGTIEMEVKPEFSVLSGFQQGNPIIDTRRAETVVRVRHGQALVIGGLRNSSVVETVRGVPGLMNVKWIGRLFSMHDTTVRESELIVLIMPEIVGYCGGLERENHALEVAKQTLSRVSTAVDGPFMCNCKDKHCPHHNPRPRIHNGMHDQGLVGGSDPIFILPPGSHNQDPSR